MVASMKLDIVKIEQDIYEKICAEFADFCEKKLEIYQTVLEFFKVTTVEDIVTLTASEIYAQYEAFCQENNIQPLKKTVFSQIVCRCGFHCFRTTNAGKKTIYYVMD